MDYIIQDCWTMISQDLVDTAIDQFSKQLTLVIRAQGGHIEHRLNWGLIRHTRIVIILCGILQN